MEHESLSIAQYDFMQNLPSDILLIIFSYLNEKALCNLARVSKRIKQYAFNPVLPTWKVDFFVIHIISTI